MTKDEIEKGRAAYEARQQDFRWDVWLIAHGAELLALAEEARWRDVAEELPEGDCYVLAAEPSGNVDIRLFYDGRWASNKEKPTHWRPLKAKGPER